MKCEKTGKDFNPETEPGALVHGVPFFMGQIPYTRKIHLSKKGYELFLKWLEVKER